MFYFSPSLSGIVAEKISSFIASVKSLFEEKPEEEDGEYTCRRCEKHKTRDPEWPCDKCEIEIW